MVEAKLLRKKLKNGLIVDKWDLVTIIEKQQSEIEALKEVLEVKVILNEHAQQSMKEYKELLK